jgi:hypothetical protein
VVDLISEGPIKGIVGGLRGIYLDGTPMLMPNGRAQFPNTTALYTYGNPNQPIMSGFAAQQAETAVGVQLKAAVPVTRSIINKDCDRCRVTLSTPALQYLAEDGSVWGVSVIMALELSNNGGAYRRLQYVEFVGKTNSNYQRSITFSLPPPGPWDIRLTRTTADSAVLELQNDTFWDSMTEIIDDRVAYAWSACVGLKFDAEQFRTIPKRTYLVDGLLCLVPDNYNAFTGVYSGTWTGNFKRSWTNNPAWVFYDLVTKNRYGLGEFIPPASIDKWALYKIAQWCDGMVPDGRGGSERRWLCNGVISSQQEAFDLLAQIAAIFRGFTYWSGGLMIAVADQPADPVMQFINANVIDGLFTYSGTDIKARHTMVRIGWNDPSLLGEPRMAIVEDQPAISRYGIQQVDIPAFGCDRESQAIRTGKWTLYTEQFEGEAVQFVTGLDSAWARPGDIVRIMDQTISGLRHGGRVGTGSTLDTIYFDAPVELHAGKAYSLSCIVGEGVVQTRQTNTVAASGNYPAITVNAPFTSIPQPDTIWVLATPTLEATLWRVIGARQVEQDRYEIGAVRHFPQKWDYVERNHAFSEPDISDITTRPSPVTNLKVAEYMIQLSSISVGIRATLSWTSPAPAFDVAYRKDIGNWQRLRTDRAAATDLAVSEGLWTFQVTPVSSLGLKGSTSTITANFIGRYVVPAAPQQFRLDEIVQGIALFSWAMATEIDVKVGGHYELRYSPATGASWDSGQVVIKSIPGKATSVETKNKYGLWMLRTFDSVNLASTTWATVINVHVPPAAPRQFRVKISDGVALFEWLPATEPDVKVGGHYELRHNPRVMDAAWASSQVVVPSIPGSATTVETVYRVGTWFLRTFDDEGFASTTWATIIALQPDGRYTELIRICENPDFLGTHNYTEVLAPQQWLVIGQTGGMWDSQMANMDSWPDVDVLAEGMPVPPQSVARHGWYLFEDRIDAGGVFTVRFSADILAFPYAEGSEFIDDRLNNCDEWADWDDVSADLEGQVQLYIRTTQEDPASAGAAWTEWQVFAPMEYTARGFEFRADLFAPAGQNIGVETLCVIADLRMKMDSAEDVLYPAATTHVTFKVKFYLLPSVVVTVQNALATDTIQVTNKTREGFDLTVQNPPPTHVTRTFDWQARGY